MLSYITGSGGVQCYVAAKAKFLEEHGWHVVVISDNIPNSKERCLISSLNKFLQNGNPYQGYHPCDIPHFMVRLAIKRYMEVIGPISDEDEAIVESWNSPTALWGELIAKQIHAKHMFLTANEYYRNPNQCYEKKIDFFMFKMDRGELFTDQNSANRLFVNYRTYKKGDFIEAFLSEDPVQDIDNSSVNKITDADWNICYIGRANKSYVPNIYNGVKEFALQHQDKSIQFIIVGEATERKQLLNSIKLPNLIVIELGDLYPLPKDLFKKVDVVIAGSGSARHSADEGALVILADPETNSSHGILGYDTNESIYADKENYLNFTFSQALERALVDMTWKSQPYRWKKSLGTEECTNIQFQIINHSSSDLNYYDEKTILCGDIKIVVVLRIIYRLVKGALNNLI